MKRIKDEVSLEDKIDTITASELRQRPGEVLDSVALGKTFVITKNGKPVAVVMKPPGQTLLLEIGPTGGHSYKLS